MSLINKSLMLDAEYLKNSKGNYTAQVTVNDALINHINLLSQKILALEEELDKVKVDSYKAVRAQFKSDTKRILKKYEEETSKLTEVNSRKFNDMIENVGEEKVKQIADIVKQVKEEGDTFKESIDQLKSKNISLIEESDLYIKKVDGQMQIMSSDVSEIASICRGLNEKYQEKCEDISSTMLELDEGLRTFYQQLGEETVEKVEATSDKITRKVDLKLEKMEIKAYKLEQEIHEIAGNKKNIMDELNSSFLEVNSNLMTELDKNIDHINQTFDEVKGKFNDLVDNAFYPKDTPVPIKQFKVRTFDIDFVPKSRQGSKLLRHLFDAGHDFSTVEEVLELIKSTGFQCNFDTWNRVIPGDEYNLNRLKGLI